MCADERYGMSYILLTRMCAMQCSLSRDVPLMMIHQMSTVGMIFTWKRMFQLMQMYSTTNVYTEGKWIVACVSMRCTFHF